MTRRGFQIGASNGITIGSGDNMPTSLNKPITTTTKIAVQFSHVEIHEFPPAIGHNPSVTAGVPITLGDQPVNSFNFSLVDYEEARIGQRRSTRQLHLPKEIREERLLAQGFARSEIVQAVRAARIARTNRKQSNDSRAIAEAVEEASKMLKRLMKGGLNSNQPQGPSPLKLGATNADLKGRSNCSASSIQSERTISCESSNSTFYSQEFSRGEPTNPLSRKASFDSLPRLPSRESLKEEDSSCCSDCDQSIHMPRQVPTTLREALSLNSGCHDAPKLPARRISSHEDLLIADASHLVEALQAVDEIVQRHQVGRYQISNSPRENRRLSKPSLAFALCPSDDELEADDEIKKSTFGHSYPTEQAPQAPSRVLRAWSPAAS